jgi:hypothetical protein
MNKAELVVGFNARNTSIELESVELLRGNKDFIEYVRKVLSEEYNYHGRFRIDSSMAIGLPF